MTSSRSTDPAAAPVLAQVLPAYVPGAPSHTQPSRLVIVEDPDVGTVPVRWRIPPWTQERDAWSYRCSTCGTQTTPSCAHAYSAALLLSRSLLGLTPVTPALPATPYATAPTAQETHA